MKRSLTLLGVGLVLGASLMFAAFSSANSDITKKTIQHAANIIGLEFTSAEQDSMISSLENLRETYQMMREREIPNHIPPAIQFNPVPLGKTFETVQYPVEFDIPVNVDLPENSEKLAFCTVAELASLIKQKKISSVELTEFFLNRIALHGDKLEAIIKVTRERAMTQAKKLDIELANGKYRGPLHGIPYGLKDLFAVKGTKTTWGATPYKDQEIDVTATVVEKLDGAGAILIAKTTLGALAYGDVWFGGKTRNPWNLEQGSSGSSAGSASGTAAGLFPFALGTETLGSIVSPSTRNGATGLRPTYGRVSRHGAMALSWTMDKVGPITRSAEDLAIVFNAIYGPDEMDQTLIDLPFNYDQNIDWKTLKIGYHKSAFDSDYYNHERDSVSLAVLESLGANLVPIELPDIPAGQLTFILTAEAAAAFDDLTRSNEDDEMVWQERNAWPNLFRAHRFVPAVEYIQANRIRYQLIQEMETIMQEVDLYITPAFAGGNLYVTNLTGHPSVVVPNGFNENGGPVSITFTGDLFDEGTIIKVAKAYQKATAFDEQHPPMFSGE